MSMSIIIIRLFIPRLTMYQEPGNIAATETIDIKIPAVFSLLPKLIPLILNKFNNYCN